MLRAITIKGKIRTKTGIRIGGSKDNINIGGVDNIVIKNPIDNKPYIPGSSIKGKMRFLMEWKYGKVGPNGSVHNCDDSNCPVCGLFGSTKFSDKSAVPTRLIVRDAFLVEEYRRKDLSELLEEKVENSINRLRGNAISPRTMERVVPEVEFEFEMVLRLFDDDNEEEWMRLLTEALGLLKSDYLGGSGSRGYGKIEFVDLEKNGKTLDLPENVETNSKAQ